MGLLSNPKHERFAQELAKGKSQEQAYVAAGYKRDDGHAARLAGVGRIKERVAEILERVAAKTEITVEKLTEMYLSDRRGAIAAMQYAAAKGAVDSLAKLHGLWIEKSERTNIDGNRSTKELEQELERLRADLPGEAETKHSYSN